MKTFDVCAFSFCMACIALAVVIVVNSTSVAAAPNSELSRSHPPNAPGQITGDHPTQAESTNQGASSDRTPGDSIQEASPRSADRTLGTLKTLTQEPPAEINPDRLLQETICINFQHPLSSTPQGYLPDIGEVFGQRAHGLSYGWLGGRATESRERHEHADPRLDTFIHLTKGPSRQVPGQTLPHTAGGSDGYNFIWAITVPNGLYEIEIYLGDPVYRDHVNSITLNGKAFLDESIDNHFDQVITQVQVDTGRIEISAHPSAKTPKICYLHLKRQ